MKMVFPLAIALAAFVAGPALAADLPLKASTMPPAVYNWTGCYVGANGGYAWNDRKSGYRDPNTDTDPINGRAPSVFFPPPNVSATIPTPSNTNSSGWVGGGQVGCNWQVDRRIVLGVEADIDALSASGSAATVGPTISFTTASNFYQVGSGAVLGLGTTGTANEQVSARWLSTIRARAGLPVLSDRGLLFLTGGLAIAEVSSSGSVNIFQANSGFGLPTILTWSGSSTSTRVGYAVGGGLEYALTGPWTVKGEYLYYDVGQNSHPLNLNVIANGTGTNRANLFYPTLGNTVSSVSGSIIRVGLNYRFSSGPVVARY